MPDLGAITRRALSRLAFALAALALARRAAGSLRRARERRARDTRRARSVLPSLYEVYPGANAAPRRRLGLRTVPLDRIVGTTRRPSQNTADFLPLPKLRGRNWAARWQRIDRAMNRLEMLPPVSLVKLGDDYFVEDGHNRVAAARQIGSVDIDADVIELTPPGSPPPSGSSATGLLGTQEIRQASQGRTARAVDLRRLGPEALPRRQLADVATSEGILEAEDPRPPAAAPADEAPADEPS